MKFAIFALIVGLCLAVVQAKNFDVKAFAFGSTIPAALLTSKGLDCAIEEVGIIKAAAEEGVVDLESCGGTVSKEVEHVINSLNEIVDVGLEIIDLKLTTCKGDGSTLSKSCKLKLQSKLLALTKDIENSLDIIQQLPNAETIADDCVNEALGNVFNAFIEFPTDVVKCSKLADN